MDVEFGGERPLGGCGGDRRFGGLLLTGGGGEPDCEASRFRRICAPAAASTVRAPDPDSTSLTRGGTYVFSLSGECLLTCQHFRPRRGV